MKKILALVLALVMALSLCACSGDSDPTVDDGSNNPTQGTNTKVDLSQFKGKLLENSIKLIASGNYMYEAKGSSDTTPITYAKVGDNTLITCVSEGVPTSFITMNGKKYIAFAAQKVYAQLTDSEIQKYAPGFDNSIAALDFTDLKSCTFKSTGSMSIGEATYTYEDYYNPLKQTTNRFVFDAQNNLAYMTIVDASGKQGDLVSISLFEANPSVFDVLQTYTLVDLSKQQAYQPSTDTTQAQ